MIQLWQSLLLGIVARLKMWLRGQLLAQSVSFIHLANPTVAMGFHACCGGGWGGLQQKSFSVVLSAAPTVAMTTISAIFLSVTF